ncbi:TetR/AcrR family transcriptional regulator [Porticoccus sp. GXU_MW_L64]
MASNDNPSRNTRNILLDVAERLFADHGYHGVSVRDITEQAGTRLASINYYFGAKTGLYAEVILRRAHILHEERLTLLRAIDFENLQAETGVSRLVEAFTKPLLRHSIKGDPGWSNYCRLIAQVAVLREPPPEDVIEEFNVPALEFVSCLKRLLPTLNDRKAHYAFQFMLGTTLYIFAENQRLEKMSKGRYKSSDLSRICKEAAEYITGGILRLGVGK